MDEGDSRQVIAVLNRIADALESLAGMYSENQVELDLGRVRVQALRVWVEQDN